MSNSTAYSQAISYVGQSGYSGYQKLDQNKNQIRLLQLQSNSEGEGLKYTLDYTSLRSPKTYSALSYYWGAPVANAKLISITVGGNSIRIRPTLDSFLRTHAKLHPEERIWLDVLCINQNDVEERSHQVSIMGDIYHSAQRVYAWLGIGDADTDYALQHSIPSTATTPFSPQTFSLSIEQVFQRPYWTRRWIIQEFILAPEVWIMCGEQICKWEMLVHKMNDLPPSLPIVQAVSENLRKARESQSGSSKSLLSLMQDFKQSRCVDSRDKAYALRALAADGGLLTPNYAKSNADVYFGVLSVLPTEKILPEMRGYRWPHQAASQLQSCMELTKKDFFGSLAGDARDRLYTVFEYTGVIATVQEALQKEPQSICHSDAKLHFPFHVQLQGSRSKPLHGSGDLKSGDIVYSMQSTPNSPKGLFIAFRSTLANPAAVGMLISHATTEARSYWAEMQISFEKMKLIERISLYGVVRCSRNATARSTKGRLLCHINRLALILFWLLDLRQVDHLGAHHAELWNEPFKRSLLCDCPVRNDISRSTTAESQRDRGPCLEILPSFHPTSAQQEDKNPWTASNSQIWSDTGLQSSQVQYQMNSGSLLEPEPIDFYTHGRTELSYAAGDGHILFTNALITDAVNSKDDDGLTPLSWACRNGHDAVAKLLAGRDDVVAMLSVDRDGKEVGNRENNLLRSIWWAADQGHEKVVQALLDTGKVDPEFTGSENQTTLIQAVCSGSERVVRLLLDIGKADPNHADLYNDRTPLLWAAYSGKKEVVQILLDTGKVDINRKDRLGHTPLSLAIKMEHYEVAKILRLKGARKRPKSGFRFFGW